MDNVNAANDPSKQEIAHPSFDSQKFYERRIKPLIGADEFKSLMKEMIDVEPRIREDCTFDVFAHQYYLFAISEGAGLNEYLSIMYDFIYLKELMKLTDTRGFTVYHMPLNKTVEETSRVAYDIYLKAIEGGKKIICLNIAEWLGEIYKPEFRAFFEKYLIMIEKFYTQAVVVFRIPYLVDEVTDGVYDLLSNILTVRKVRFEPLTMEQLVQYGQKTLKGYHFSAEEKVWELFRQRIIQEKNDGKFYENMTVEKLIRELVYKKQCADTKSGKKDYLIVESDVADFVPDYYSDERTAEQLMASLVGLDGVKEQIDEIVKTIAYLKQNKDMKPHCIHMRFLGNPGTGKTTVARIIGKLLKEKGVLKKGDFFEVAGRDLCGEYIGQTNIITSRICRDAFGSVLFIDEAYSLYVNDESGKDYGREALSTLIGVMENHRDDLVIIMAGYTDEMNELMKGNPGLESRMPYIMKFPNYDRGELTEIFFRMIPETVRYDDRFKKSVTDYFNAMDQDTLEQKEFSNARFVRNLYERTFSKAVVRFSKDDSEVTLTPEDFELACTGVGSGSLNGSGKRRVGFLTD